MSARPAATTWQELAWCTTLDWCGRDTRCTHVVRGNVSDDWAREQPISFAYGLPPSSTANIPHTHSVLRMRWKWRGSLPINQRSFDSFACTPPTLCSHFLSQTLQRGMRDERHATCTW